MSLRVQPVFAADAITNLNQLGHINRDRFLRINPDQQVVRLVGVDELVVRLLIIKRDPLDDPRFEQELDRAVDRRLGDLGPLITSSDRLKKLLRLKQAVEPCDHIENPGSFGCVFEPLGLELAAKDRAQRFYDLQALRIWPQGLQIHVIIVADRGPNRSDRSDSVDGCIMNRGHTISLVLGLALASCLQLAGCQGGSEIPTRPSPLADLDAQVLGDPNTRTDQPHPVAREHSVTVFAPPLFAPVLGRLEAMYEAVNHDVDVYVRIAPRGPDLDPSELIGQWMGSGVETDVYIAEEMADIRSAGMEPILAGPWVGDRLIVVTGRGSRLRMVDLSKGDAPIAIALDRTALGRLSRLALKERGIWNDISYRIGHFDGSAAIIERARFGGQSEHILGVVYGSALTADPRSVKAVGEIMPPPHDRALHAVGAWTPRGRSFATWLLTDEALAAAAEHGFVPLRPLADQTADGSNP